MHQGPLRSTANLEFYGPGTAAGRFSTAFSRAVHGLGRLSAAAVGRVGFGDNPACLSGVRLMRSALWLLDLRVLKVRGP